MFSRKLNAVAISAKVRGPSKDSSVREKLSLSFSLVLSVHGIFQLLYFSVKNAYNVVHTSYWHPCGSLLLFFSPSVLPFFKRLSHSYIAAYTYASSPTFSLSVTVYFRTRMLSEKLKSQQQNPREKGFTLRLSFEFSHYFFSFISLRSFSATYRR